MSRPARLAAAQLGPSGTRDENVVRMCQLLDRAAEQGADIVGFPELSLTPYFCARNHRDYEQYFEPIDSPCLQQVLDHARRRSLALVLPWGERDGIQYYNAALVADPKGRIVGRYRKVHIPGAFPFPDSGALVFEKLYFTPGDLGYPVMDVGFAKVGVQICYDRNFPEGYRILALEGAEIVYTPTALMRIGDVWNASTWELVLRARGYENGLFIVGVNKAGHEWDLDYVGDSLVVDPKDGSIMAQSQSAADDLLVVEVDLDDIQEARKRLPFMRDRRPLTYSRIVNG
jgi:predicted amidohydrolase